MALHEKSDGPKAVAWDLQRDQLSQLPELTVILMSHSEYQGLLDKHILYGNVDFVWISKVLKLHSLCIEGLHHDSC